MSSSINIALPSDANYLPGLVVTIASALATCNTEDRLHFFILTTGLTSTDRQVIADLVERAEKKANITFVSLRLEALAHLNSQSGNYVTYASLFLSELVPAERVILLDPDFLVTRSFAPVWEGLTDADHLLAVPDPRGALGQDCPWPLSAAEQELPYFNAGLLVANLAQWRASGITKEIQDLLRDPPAKLCFHDQTTLNYVFRQRKRLLPSEWNALFWIDPHYERILAAGPPWPNLHLVGRPKPWEEGDTSMRGSLWWAVARKTLSDPLWTWLKRHYWPRGRQWWRDRALRGTWRFTTDSVGALASREIPLDGGKSLRARRTFLQIHEAKKRRYAELAAELLALYS